MYAYTYNYIYKYRNLARERNVRGRVVGFVDEPRLQQMNVTDNNIMYASKHAHI